MSNWSNPTLSSTYTNFLNELKARDDDLAVMFSGTQPTNMVTNTIKWDIAASRFEIWGGSSWSALDSTYEINVSNLGGQPKSYYESATNITAGTLPSGRINDGSHGNLSGGALHADVVANGADGFMTGADKFKLDGIDTGAKDDQTGTEILAALAPVDGATSGLDADKLDNLHASSFIRSDASGTVGASSITWNDSSYIRLGTGADMRMHHNGTSSYVDNYTGDFVFRQRLNSGYGYLQGEDSGATLHTCVRWGGTVPYVALYYDAVAKLDTTSAGINVTGNIAVTGTVDGRDVGADGSTLDTVEGAYIRGDGVNNGTISIQTTDTDFVVADVNETGVTNYIYRDHSANKLYLGADQSVVTLRSSLDLNNEAITNINWAASDDGAGSGLDADKLDGQEGAYYAPDSTNIAQGQHTFMAPAKAFTPRTTNGAEAGTLAVGSTMLSYFSFDTTVEEGIILEIPMPKSWNHATTLNFAVDWSHPATTTNFGVVWGCEILARGNSDPLNAAFGVPIYAVDTGGTTNDMFKGSKSGAVTPSGTPAAEDTLLILITRVVGHTSDNMAVDARLHGVKFYYTVDLKNDS